MPLLDLLLIRFRPVWDKGKLLVLCKVLRAFCLESWLGFCGPLLLLSLFLVLHSGQTCPLSVPTGGLCFLYVNLFLEFP